MTTLLNTIEFFRKHYIKVILLVLTALFAINYVEFESFSNRAMETCGAGKVKSVSSGGFECFNKT